MGMWFAGIVALLSAFLAQAGDAQGAAPAPAVDFKPRAHLVAVVSALGDVIGYQAINVALMDGGYSDKIKLDGADLDGAAVSAAVHVLTQDVPGFGLASIEVPHDTLVAHANSILLGDGPLNRIRNDLKAWRESHAVDLVIVLLPVGGQIDRHDEIKRAFFGIGISGRQTILFLRAVVLDGKSGEILSDLKARAVGSLSGQLAEATFSHPTAADKAMLAMHMRGMIASTVPGLLRGVGL